MRRVRDSKSICDNNGFLNDYAIGWNDVPFKDCSINQCFLKKKIWNHYIWISEEFVFNFLISDLGHCSIIHADFYNLKDDIRISKIYRHPLIKYIVIDDNINSYAHYKGKRKFINILRSSNYLNLDLKLDDFDITSTIYLDYESLNVLIPWDFEHFHYTSKHMNLITKGILRIGEMEYDLSNSKCFIDYGRGVLKRKCEWDWLTSGFTNEKHEHVSINLGAKYTDYTGVNENALKIDDKIYKFDSDIYFKYNNNDCTIDVKSMKGDEVNLKFKPIIRDFKPDNIKIFKFKLKQMVGYINGYVMCKDKKVIFNNEIGWCESHFAKR
ncbi:DUF2804 family protein [Paraclostridium ghonii]|uniref:DUF2804 family protein n=1 Tax=Paraclostridium ghonii TaxID=29358 RepID=UPI00202CCE79|nr:DUF2804 family protein [Paeniclostridium ghonii]MCM0167771.1 DUF2804 domain-containing protein [Paeniclostridium ghonii]